MHSVKETEQLHLSNKHYWCFLNYCEEKKLEIKQNYSECNVAIGLSLFAVGICLCEGDFQKGLA